MFVIRRKPGQSIQIGDDIVIEVLDATPSRVKLGVHAPDSVRVARTEVLIAEAQNRCAAVSAPLESLEGLAQRLRVSLNLDAGSSGDGNGGQPSQHQSDKDA